jgi:hypothetical protein
MRWALASTVAWLAAACPVAVAHADERSAYERAEARIGVADFEAAASLFEASASASCGSDAWERAVRLRVDLEETSLASSDADRFARICGQKEPGRVARILLVLAEGHAANGRWRAAAGAATAAVRWADRAQSTPLRAAAHVRLGAALWQANERSGATSALAAAIADATRGGASQADAKGAAEKQEALAEARFWLAEAIRQAHHRAVVLPRYRGDWSRDSIYRYYDRVMPELRRQWGDAVTAEAAFLRVFGVPAKTRRCVRLFLFSPDPPRDWVDCGDGPDASERLVLSQDPLADAWNGTPPSARWAIASAQEIGAIWREVYDTYFALSLSLVRPRKEGAVTWERECWDCGGGPEAPEDALHRAMAGFSTCLRLSRAFKIIDDLEACSAGKARFITFFNDGAERIEELFPRIGYLKRRQELPAALPFPGSSAARPSL